MVVLSKRSRVFLSQPATGERKARQEVALLARPAGPARAGRRRRVQRRVAAQTHAHSDVRGQPGERRARVVGVSRQVHAAALVSSTDQVDQPRRSCRRDCPPGGGHGQCSAPGGDEQ
jgi:hypothetical protein